MDRLRRRRQQIPDHKISLGDPRSFIEQPRCLIERFEIEPDQRGAERGPALERLAVRFLRSLVAEEDQLAVARHAQPEVGGKPRHLRQRPAARIGIGAIGAGHRGQRRHRVVNTERKERHAIERPACRHHAGGGDQSKTRLEPDDIVERRRNAPGARSVGAQAEAREPDRHRDRRTGARAAGHVVRVEAVARHAVRRAHADQAGGELIEIGLADQNRAGRAQPRYRGCVVRRHIGERRATGRGGQAGDVDIVLYRNGNAIQRKLRGILRAQSFRLGDRRFFAAQADEDGGVVVIANPRKASRDGLRGRGGAGAMRGDDRSDRFSHARPRAGTSLIGECGNGISDAKWKVGPRFAIADCAPGGRKSVLNRSKQCAIVYMAMATSIRENQPILSIAWLI